MHIVFGLSALVQVALAVHAYRRGRVSPWIWIILFFPVLGSQIYVVLFVWPSWKRRLFSSGARAEDLQLREVTRGPFARSGDRPDRAIRIASPSDVPAKVARDGCPDCEGDVRLEEQRRETLGGRELEVAVLVCEECGAMPIRYFELASE